MVRSEWEKREWVDEDFGSMGESERVLCAIEYRSS